MDEVIGRTSRSFDPLISEPLNILDGYPIVNPSMFVGSHVGRNLDSWNSKVGGHRVIRR